MRTEKYLLSDLKKYTALFILLIGLAWPVQSGLAQSLPRRYHRYTEMRSILTALRDAHPEIIKLDTMGYSTRLQVPMLRLKISNAPNIDQDEPVALIAGGAHANEVLGPEMVLGFIQDLIHRYEINDQQALTLINSLEIYCVPYINPEGHIVVEGGDFDWRKNQCDNDSNGVFNFHDGVDNNRNYNLAWSLAHNPNATTPESSMYRGTAPFTQSENIAMRDFGWHYHPVIALDYHSPFYSLGETIYHPWYWRNSDGGNGAAPDEVMLSDIGTHFASLIINDAGDSTYRSGRNVVSEGNINTYFYGNFGTAIFTVELSDTTIQRSSLVDSIIIRNLPATYYLLERILQGRITGTVRDSVTLEPLDAEVQVMERINADIRPRLCRTDFGRYDRLLETGFYTLRFIKSGYVFKQIYTTVANTPVTYDVLLSPLAPRPPAPILLFPVNAQNINDNQFTFDWSDVALANRYLLELGSDSVFSYKFISDSNVTNSVYQLTSPLADGQYFWRVKAGNGNGWGPYSAIFRFIVDAQSVIGNTEMPLEFSLYQNYPNPFNSKTTIFFELDKPSLISLYIYSLHGELVTSLAHEFWENSGVHRIVWDGTDLLGQPIASGIYFYRLEADGQHHSRSLLMIK
jgi:hypothetical protein